MRLNVRRKVREVNLKYHELLLPLHEVIVNSIQAIEDKGEKNGLIKIEINRNEDQAQIEEFDTIYPIKSFVVTDNGIGFNENEFNAFNDAYTERKLERGGKGVGRFTVLSAFRSMDMESRFTVKDKTYFRKFSFSVEKEIEEVVQPEISKDSNTGTKITLNSYLPGFLEKSRLSIEIICEEIVNHILIYFLTESAPKIIVFENEKKYDLRDFYKQFLFEQKVESIEIEKSQFNLYFLRKLNTKGSHQIHFCAHNRQVKSIQIKGIIPNLYKSIEDKNGKIYFISIYVTGDYLNNNLNEIRNSFLFPTKISEKDSDMYRNIALEEIETRIKELLEIEYAKEINAIEDDKLKTINEYVLSGKGIEYRHLLDYHAELAAISPEDLAVDKLDNELHKINYQLEKKHRNNVAKILDKSVENTEEYSNELKRILIDESNFSQSKLANYVIRRKVVLNVFDKFLDWQEDNKFKWEEDLHNIIFPMGGDNDIVPFNKHNLWLLDERLTFHTYIASDKKIQNMKTIDSDSSKEPDLAIFDKRWAYSPDDEFSSLVIFEFKRPGRAVADSIDKQVINYFKLMIDGKTKTYRGRSIDIDKDTPKFGYIICEIDRSLREDLLTWHSYKNTPSGTLYKYWSELNMYVEIMNFQHVHKSATERHQAFFRMLGIEKQ